MHTRTITRTHTHTHTHKYIYIYIYIERERERESICPECFNKAKMGFFFNRQVKKDYAKMTKYPYLF